MPSRSSDGTVPGARFFAAYVGPSMNPTLREPEIVEVVPYGGTRPRVGDVAFLVPPRADQPVVHRIIRVTAAGISTLGDNNSREDPLLWSPDRIRGRVVAAWRGQSRRQVWGGLPGRWASRWLRWRRVLERSASPALRPLFQALSRRGWIARVLPAPLRPRVVVFHVRGRDQLQLLLGRRSIGRYDDQRQQWQIQRPFQLLVDGRVLPGLQERARLNRGLLAERQRLVDRSVTHRARRDLVLADGSRWDIVPADEEAASIVSELGRVMQLRGTTDAAEAPPGGRACRLLVQVDAHNTSVADFYVPLAADNDGVVLCVLSPSDHWGGPPVNLVRLSLVFAREAQARGGVLVHGALAERDGAGVILAAPGGTGKTTASNRLPPPWRSRCDDTTLVVRDRHGSYWAHPWPTWSRFVDGGPGGSWDVQDAVPLKGVFVLAQAAEDRVERVGPGQAVSLLGECVGQASTFMAPGLSEEGLHALHVERFNNLCALSRALPVHVLRLSLTGPFWEEIEDALWGGHGKARSDAIDKNEPGGPLPVA